MFELLQGHQQGDIKKGIHVLQILLKMCVCVELIYNIVN